MKHLFSILTLTIVFSFTGFAQDWTLPLTGKVEKNGKKLQGSTVTLMQGSKQIAQTMTGDDGAFRFEIPPNGDFMIVVSKQGHCTKKFQVSTRGVPPDDKSTKRFDIPGISLFEPLPNIDYSVLNQPLVKIQYNSEKTAFDYDEAYFAQSLAALDKLKQLEADAVNKQKELESNYQSAIKIADKAFLKKDWNTAKQKGYSVPDYKIEKCTPKIVYVPNGNIEGCGKYKSVYANPSIENSLKISVGNNTNVAAKLINYANGKCYRYVFIQRNSTYSMRNIPEGKYYLKIAYGYDWTVFGSQSNCEGRFTRDVLYKKSTQTFDFNLITTNRGVQIPYFELELNVVTTTGEQNTFNSSQINPNDFYNE